MDNLTLFPEIQKAPAKAPLADRMRPSTLDDFEGADLLEKNLLRKIKEGKDVPPSLIIWGPPGSGKTTLARIIGKQFKCKFVESSAVMVGVKEIRDIVAEAKRTNIPTVLFVDEIHRFNKSQQDAFLPHVESGVITLIGATTENPSFYLTSALLSRTKVVTLNSHTDIVLRSILSKALTKLNLQLGEEVTDLLCRSSGGDARRLLNLLEAIKDSPNLNDVTKISNDISLFYDRGGEEHYNMISAFIKSMRGSDPNAALYWCYRMIESGEDPRFIIRRMIIFASEDIGNADPQAVQLAVSVYNAFETVGLPEGKIPIAQCVTYLSTAPKSNRSYVAMNAAIEAIKEHPKISVPLHLRNAPTELMKSLDYGKDYVYPHDVGGFAQGVQYLPDEVKDAEFYKPSEFGFEAEIIKRMKSRR